MTINPAFMAKKQPASIPFPSLEVLEQSSLPIAICEFSGKSVFLNEAYSLYFREGWKGEEIIAGRFVNEENWEQIIQSLTHHGDWDSYAILSKNSGEEIVLKVKASLIKASGTKYVALYFTETNEARRRIFRQGQLLKAASESSTLLILSEDFSEILGQISETIGKAVQADRCYIFESTFLPDSDQIYASLVAQWTRPSMSSSDELIGMISYTIFPEFYESLLNDRAYSKTQENLVGNSRKYLKSRMIQSFICLPIFKDGQLWGFMGFDDCQHPRIWDEQEIASLRLLTNSLSSVLSNSQLRTELERKNVQLESAIRGSKDSLWDYDVRKEKIYYSPQFLEMLGYQENELDGTLSDLDKIVYPKDLYKIFKGLQYVVNSGREINGFEIRLLTKNQDLLWIRVTAKPSTDMRGNTLRISGSNTNITLEKTYESKIAESQEKYIELVDNLREIVFQLNFLGNIKFLNEAWNILSGFSVSGSMGKPFREFILEEDRSKFDDFLKHLQQNKNAYLSCLVRISRKKTDITWAEIYARSFNKKGNEPYILGTIIDVSQRQITEQKLKDSEMRYRLISENLSDLVTLQDELGHFIYVSPSIQNILGMSPDSMLNKTPRQIWNPEILKDTSWERDLFDPKQENRKSYRFLKENETEIWLETLRSLVYTDDGDRFIIQSTTRDISTFKEAELNLKTALDKQRELNELKSNFISMASHEFRTPLTTIRSSMQLLEEYGKSAPQEQKLKMEKHYGRIKEQIERVTRLMNDVLTLGKFDAGKTPFNAKPHDIVRFCEELVADHFSNMNDGREISIEVLGNNKSVSFDTNLMTHVLLNLIANAFKYSANRANPELEVSFEKKSVKLKIRDFGIGIPPDDINLVFQTFYRAKNAIEVPGTGLGLVITKEFVELHNGSISIESQLNKETKVTVELPID